jgi:hypothetical protein
MATTRERPAWGRGLLAVALATLTSGCSFASVQRPRPPDAVDDPRTPDTCTTSSEAPVADTVLGGIGLVGGYVAFVLSLAEDLDCVDTATHSCSSGNPAPGLAVMGAGALFAASAIYGYVATAKCRHRIVASGRCANGDLGACWRVKPGWAPPPAWRSGPTLQPRPYAAPPAYAPPGGTPEWTQEPAPPAAPPPP